MRSVLLVNGSSDDRTEVYGTIRAEFTRWPPGERTVCFDDGSQVTIEYNEEGIWRVTDVSVSGDYSSYCVLDPGDISIFAEYTETAVLKLDSDVSDVALVE